MKFRGALVAKIELVERRRENLRRWDSRFRPYPACATLRRMMKLHEPGHRMTRLIAPVIAAVALALALHPLAIAQQPCNPVIDGTYCAEQMPRARTWSPTDRPIMRPIGEISTAVSVGGNSPGTLGGISFGAGGTTCIGLLRRGVCN
jgi:hypothetical protein